MKKSIYSFKSLPISVSLISCMFLTGCYQEALEEETVTSGSSKLSVITRSVTNDALQYPLTVYAFDEKGVCKAEKIIQEGETNVKLNLSDGNYKITAVAGTSGVAMPNNPSQSSTISTLEGNYSTSPLSMGQANASVSGSSSVTLQMCLQQASIEICLNDLASNVSAVSVSIAKQYSKIDFDGTLYEEKNTLIECKKNGETWTTGKIYMFPSSTDNTVFTITVTDPTGTHNFGYTYNAEIKAGVPYILNGSFSTGFSFNGTIVSSGWEEEVVLNFNFGPGIEETGGENNTEPETPSTSVSKIPAEGTIWNGHVVAYVENASKTEADLILLSLLGWNKISSASNVDDPDEAIDIANVYNENGMSGWSIPTKAEAISLRTLYSGESIYIINDVLEEAGGEIMTGKESNSNNARYLCEDALYTYTLGGSTSITQAGAKTKYRLRLVKRVHVSVN